MTVTHCPHSADTAPRATPPARSVVRMKAVRVMGARAAIGTSETSALRTGPRLFALTERLDCLPYPYCGECHWPDTRSGAKCSGLVSRTARELHASCAVR